MRIFIDECHEHKNLASGVYMKLKEIFPESVATVHGPRLWAASGTPWESSPAELRGYWTLTRPVETAYWLWYNRRLKANLYVSPLAFGPQTVQRMDRWTEEEETEHLGYQSQGQLLPL